MSEKNTETTGARGATARGPLGDEFEQEVREASAGAGLDLDVSRGPAFEDPVSTPGDLSEPKPSFEVGGDNACKCEGNPELDVDKGEVGAWRFQIVFCSECMHRFGAAVTPVKDASEEGESDG